MREYSLGRAIVASFYSGDLYRDVALRWTTGRGFLYLLVVVAVSMAFVSIHLHRRTGAFLRAATPAFLEQVPTIEIADGRVSIDGPQPRIIEANGEPFVALDTTGTWKTLDDTPAKMLLTADAFWIRESGGDVKMFPLDNVSKFSLTPAMVQGLVEVSRSVAGYVIYPFAVAFFYAFRVLQMLIYGLAGLLLALALGGPRSYATWLRLAAVAVTPAMLFATVVRLSGVEVPQRGFIAFAIALLFLGLAAKANAARDAEPPPVPV